MIKVIFKIALLLCFSIFISSVYAKTVELRHLEANPDAYIGKTITVKGESNPVRFDQDNSRAEFSFMHFDNVDIIVSKGTPLYEKLVDMEIKMLDEIKVTGVVHNYRNSSKVYIEASDVSRSILNFRSLAGYIFGGFVILVFIVQVFGKGNKKIEPAPTAANEVSSSESSDPKLS